ncbi:MAG: TonB-dependent receptor [Myxococcales bacterium]|nr:TonB-dependent receptor [Myxococcales bacterium]
MLIGALMGQPAWAQAPRLGGRVIDSTGQPVIGARIATDDNVFETYSLADGTFAFEAIQSGELVLMIDEPDFEVLTFRVTLLSDGVLSLELRLSPLKKAKGGARSGDGETLIVKARRPAGNLTRYTLEREVLRSVPGSFGDPLRAVQNLPGISRAPYSVGILLVRGTGPGDSAVFVDGHEIPLAYHFLGGPSILAAEMIHEIHFLPGNFSSRYGRAIGGIIDVTTRDGTRDEFKGAVDIDLFDAGFFVEGPVDDRTSIAVSARRSYIDTILRGAASASGKPVAAVLPVYYDYQARIDHALTGRQALTLLLFGSEDHLSVVGEPSGSGPDTGVDARIAFHRAKAEWSIDLTNEARLEVSPVVGIDQTSLGAGAVSIDATAMEYGLRVDLKLKPLETLEVRTGLDVLARDVELSAFVPLNVPRYRPFPNTNAGDREPESLKRTVSLTTAALFAEAEFKPGDGPLTLSPGARAELFAYFDQRRFAIDPRVNARFALTDSLSLKGGAGLYSQNPTETRLDPELGNPLLPLEWAEHYALGFELKTTRLMSVEATAFLARRHDLSVPSETPTLTADGAAPERFAATASGRSYGLELLIRRELGQGFYGWIAYTLSRAEERPDDASEYELFPLDQTHHLIAVFSRRLPSSWEVGMRLQLVSGNLDTPIIGRVFDADQSNYAAITGAPDSIRQSLYHQLDLRVEKTADYGDFKLAYYLDVQNVENAPNAEFTTWDYRFRESAPVPGIPVLPTLGVRGTYL